jgi:hypothetical protein
VIVMSWKMTAAAVIVSMVDEKMKIEVMFHNVPIHYVTMVVNHND